MAKQSGQPAPTIQDIERTAVAARAAGDLQGAANLALQAVLATDLRLVAETPGNRSTYSNRLSFARDVMLEASRDAASKPTNVNVDWRAVPGVREGDWMEIEGENGGAARISGRHYTECSIFILQTQLAFTEGKHSSVSPEFYKLGARLLEAHDLHLYDGPSNSQKRNAPLETKASSRIALRDTISPELWMRARIAVDKQLDYLAQVQRNREREQQQQQAEQAPSPESSRPRINRTHLAPTAEVEAPSRPSINRTKPELNSQQYFQSLSSSEMRAVAGIMGGPSTKHQYAYGIIDDAGYKKAAELVVADLKRDGGDSAKFKLRQPTLDALAEFSMGNPSQNIARHFERNNQHSAAAFQRASEKLLNDLDVGSVDILLTEKLLGAPPAEAAHLEHYNQIAARLGSDLEASAKNGWGGVIGNCEVGATKVANKGWNLSTATMEAVAEYAKETGTQTDVLDSVEKLCSRQALETFALETGQADQLPAQFSPEFA